MKPNSHHLLKPRRALLLLALLGLSSAPSSQAAQSSPGSGEIAIYTEATGGDVIVEDGSTAAGFLTHDFDTNDREDADSFTRSGADITLNRAGHYLAIYNSQFNGAPQAGSEERVELQSYLTLGGVELASGWSQGFIRRQSTQLDAVTAGMAVFEALASDVLNLRSIRTDNTTIGSVTRVADATGLQLIKLDDVNMSYARLSLALDQAGPTNDTPVKVLYGSPDELDTGFSYTDGTGDLTLADAGKYLVIANTYLHAPNNRIGFVQQLTLDGAAIPGTRTNVYLRGLQSTEDGSAGVGTIIETTAANQVLRVLGELDGGTLAASTFVGGRCALTVVKLPDLASGTAPADPDFIRLRHTANQDVNVAADMIFDTQDEIDSEFSHTPGTSGVSVTTGGDYLFLGSFYGPDDGSARGMSNPGWEINDVRQVIGQSGRYTRNTGPPEFGNTLGLIASNLAASDKVEMVSRAIGAGGINDANPVAIQGVRLASLFDFNASFEVLVNPLAVAVEEGGATATYEVSLGLAPTSGSVEVTATADAETELSTDGVNWASSAALTFTAGGEPQTIHVRAFDDSDIESAHTGLITNAITTTGDPTNYPTTLPVASVEATIGDNDVVPVDAMDDSSITNANEDAVGDQSLIGGSVLANDTNGIGNSVSSADSVSSMGAAVSVNMDGTFSYDPTGSAAVQALPSGGSLVDTFSYTAEDIEGNTDSATVSITVDGANDGTDALPDVLNDGPLENGTFASTADLTANDGSFRSIRTPISFPAGSDLRLLPGKTVTQTPSVGTPPGNGFPENAFDGNVGTFTHTQSNNDSVDHSWQVDLGQVASLESITLANRNDCCGIRLRDITVRVLDGGGTEIFNSGPLNVGNALGFSGGADETLFVDFGGPIMGQTIIVDRETDVVDTSDGRTDNDNAGDVSILSLSEVTIIGSVPGTYILEDDFLLLNYDAAQSPGAGRWENLGSNAGSGMDWILTDVDLVSVTSARNGISAAYQWDNIADRALLNGPGGDSVHDIMPGDPDAGDATWEFWVKPDNTSQIMTIFETGGGAGFGCIINNGVLEAATELDGGSMTDSYVSYNLLTDTLGLVGNDPTTEFNQYAVTITVNGGLELYVNGVLVDDSGGSGVSGDWDGGDGSGLGRFGAANHGGFQNGANGMTYDAPFLGQMAIVRMYLGALGGDRIYQNFNAVNTGTDIDGDAISAIGVVDGGGSFVANGGQATLASGALVTMSDAAGGFLYDPNGAFSLLPGQTATDTFTYRVSEAGGGLTAESTVTLTVTGVASPIDDNLLAKEQLVVTYTPNELLKNDEIAATPGAYVDLSPPSISGGSWINAGSAGAARDGSIVGTVTSAPALASGFQTIGSASTATNLATLDPISTGDATIEIWFRPAAGQTGKSTIFDTGGNGNGFSIVFDADTNQVTANVDGGDDATANIIATASGVSTSEFNQLIVVIDRDGGAEVGAPSGVFEDLLTLYLNNDPTLPFDPSVDASGVNTLGIANDWAGTDNGGLNATQGTTALNENFPATIGEVAFFRAYPSILSPAEMEVNFDAAIQVITAVSSPSSTQGATVTLNGDGTVSVDYSGISLPTGGTLPDSFTYTTAGGTATVNVTIEGNTIQEDWRFEYYGDIANSGAGADSALAVNGLTNLHNFTCDLDPTVPAGVLEVDADAGTILSLGPPAIWVDPATGRVYLRHTRRADFASIPLTITDEFSRNPGLPFEASAVAPTVIATGTGDSGAAIEAVQSEFPLVLPTSGGKGRYGRVDVTSP